MSIFRTMTSLEVQANKDFHNLYVIFTLNFMDSIFQYHFILKWDHMTELEIILAFLTALTYLLILSAKARDCFTLLSESRMLYQG